MKQKYTLLIADMEISVITDEPQESVEYIVGILDRKMREITLKSKRCSKNEAALLCALDFCAEKIQMKDRVEILETQLDDAITDIENFKEKVELLSANIDRLERENRRLEIENRTLRGEEMTEEAEASSIEPEEKPVEEKKNPSRNRVGSMFDLLTFSDI